MRALLAVLVLAVTALALACESDDDGSAPGEFTVTSFSAVGLLPQPTAFASLGSGSMVVDLDSGDIFVLRSVPANGWLNDDVLTTAANVRYDLEERRRVVGDFEDPTPEPTGRELTSPDGDWRLEFGEGADTLMSTRSGQSMSLQPSERQGSVIGDVTVPEFAWSPGGHLLAIGGGQCGSSPLQLVDPDDGTVIILNDEGTRVMQYEWMTDGSALAASITGGGDSRIDLIEVAEPEEATLLAPLPPARMGSYALGMQWNPSGTRLLFHQLLSRPCPY